MAEQYLIYGTTLKDIADATRSKTNKDTSIPTLEIADEIRSILSASASTTIRLIGRSIKGILVGETTLSIVIESEVT